MFTYFICNFSMPLSRKPIMQTAVLENFSSVVLILNYKMLVFFVNVPPFFGSLEATTFCGTNHSFMGRPYPSLSSSLDQNSHDLLSYLYVHQICVHVHHKRKPSAWYILSYIRNSNHVNLQQLTSCCELSA